MALWSKLTLNYLIYSMSRLNLLRKIFEHVIPFSSILYFFCFWFLNISFLLNIIIFEHVFYLLQIWISFLCLGIFIISFSYILNQLIIFYYFFYTFFQWVFLTPGWLACIWFFLRFWSNFDLLLFLNYHFLRGYFNRIFFFFRFNWIHWLW